MLSDKKIFVLSTNADGQFVKAGLSSEKIFCTQGDYFHIQCKKGCHNKIYNAVEMFEQMNQARKIENTPTIIRFPFEKLVRENSNISLIRLNLDQAIVPENFGKRAVGINEDMARSIGDMVREYTLCNKN